MTTFFDTNVLVYCTDPSEPEKQAKAKQLVAQSTLAGEGVLSTQVLIELFNTLTRKQQVSAQAAGALALAYTQWPVIDSDLALVTNAIEKSVQHGLSIWDAMIVEAALRSGASVLYSEDMSHGQRFGGVTVVDPFKS